LGGPIRTGPEHTADFWSVYAEPNMVFANDGDGRFRDMSDREPGFSGDVATSRGLAFGDIDNDGDLDFLVTNCGGAARLIRNDVGDQGHWLMVQAVDPVLKRNAIGASVTVIAQGQQYHRLVTRAYSYQSSNDPRVHFGLGGATSVSEISILWPDGTSERFPGIDADQIVILEKGGGISEHD